MSWTSYFKIPESFEPEPEPIRNIPAFYLFFGSFVLTPFLLFLQRFPQISHSQRPYPFPFPWLIHPQTFAICFCVDIFAHLALGIRRLASRPQPSGLIGLRWWLRAWLWLRPKFGDFKHFCVLVFCVGFVSGEVEIFRDAFVSRFVWGFFCVKIFCVLRLFWGRKSVEESS